MRTKGRETEPVAPGLGLIWWPPFTGWQTGINAELHDTFLAISNEWQGFFGRRVAEDLQTLQQLGAAKSPEQLWMVSARFWQKAIEDYGREYAVIGKLASNGIGCSIAAAEKTAQANAQADTPLSRAA